MWERINVCGVRDCIVGVDREQQRDVDVNPLVQRLLDGTGRPRVCRGS